jgi:hypothetical protein
MPIRKTLIAVFLATATLASPVMAKNEGARLHLERELPLYGFKDVDVHALSTVQVAHITHLLHSNKSPAQIRGNIGAVLGDSLLKTLFK